MGYEQILWLLPVETPAGKEWKVTECGQMNFWCVLKRDDGGMSKVTLGYPIFLLSWGETGIDIVTPILDGTILPGVTRDSLLHIAAKHTAGSPLPGLGHDLEIHVREDTVYMSDIVRWEKEGRFIECFGSGTAAILVGIWKVGWEGKDIVLGSDMDEEVKDGEVDINGLGAIGRALYERILAIQEGRVEGHPWSVPCEV